MSYDDFVSGVVIRYAFLWSHERARGQTDGRKRRPCVIALRMPRPNGADALLLFPITTKEPLPDVVALEIPETEKRIAGLDRQHRHWVVIEESNLERIPGSWHLEPDKPIGKVSRRFLLLIGEAFRRNQRGNRIAARDD